MSHKSSLNTLKCNFSSISTIFKQFHTHLLFMLRMNLVNVLRIFFPKVEVAKNLGDPNLERPWSKYSDKSSAYQKKHQVKESESEKSEDKTKKAKVCINE